ncbi:DNA replication/repair protein RecF [Steroidobacter denitrificans]|uniref:DNA replication/repair protein RecF n=1 Tax=Steroidobacter denitrificans TaxID=465721 RepID=UPI001EED7948|nr:DNA replication and repair protein RecF [Steroidobacter denitrificans]
MLPIQVIDPGIHRLIEEGSVRRRRLMDWGVFHVEHEFLGLWRRYHRALVQRNAALKTTASLEVISAWEQELEKAGSAVNTLRVAYIERLAPYFEQITARLIGGDVRFVYRQGWAADQDLGVALQASRARDLRLKSTQVGPHRADLAFLIDGEPARDRVSRGQQKMLAAAFILSQLALRVAEQAPRACLMLDDPAAELDVDNLGKLLTVIADIPAQLIVTSVHQRGLRGLGVARMFHVEQGRFRTMV